MNSFCLCAGRDAGAVVAGYGYQCRVASDGQRAGKSSEHEQAELEGERPAEKILCAQCRHVITAGAERIQVQDTHVHTFANPQGILYQIGCFLRGPGCSYAGPLTQEWSWFSGYRWRIALCSRCLTHLGWKFVSFENHAFHGLILDRLVNAEAPSGC
ncbi:MAG: hypothetical protein GY868_02760 [Deltaproteobacteria bacterium]|nr:hypothetical protein [Deltaproteobacteria bacterium]